ncbi:MAG: GNAT family N-acetyltransferase [Aquihabitans sp.]
MSVHRRGDLWEKVQGEGLELRTLGVADLDDVASLHQLVFRDSVLSQLGFETVRRYYRWQLTGPHDVEAFGLFVGHDLVGFLVGGRFRGSMIGFVKQEKAFLARQTLRHPIVILGSRGRFALRTGTRLLFRPVKPTIVERPERVPDKSFGILAIAIDPNVQRSGMGSLLLDEAERRAAAMGMERLHLTLDPQSWGAAEFYRGQGWRRLGIPGDTDHEWLMGKELIEP